MIQVRLLAFGALKDRLGSAPAPIELQEGASVADLLSQLEFRDPHLHLRGIAVSVNAEYAQANHKLAEGDEVALLPPVSGGIGCMGDAPSANLEEEAPICISLTRDPIDSAALIAAAKAAEDGAVVVFDGIVRNHSRGRRTLHLDYEAYEEMASKQMRELAVEARSRFGVRHVTVVHRLARLEIGETSVLIVVASAHRAQAFDACRWLIDTLKKTVPIWKRETFADGAVWSDGEPFPADIALPAPEAGHDR
jgi:molybdopterin synthase catalytic subunit